MTNTNNTTVVVELNKTQKSDVIFVEEAAKGDEKLRARVIKRYKEELGMGEAGASTFYQNAKKRAAGEKVKHYRSKKAVDKVEEQVDDSKEDAALIDIELADGTIKSFLSQQAADEWKAENAAQLAA